MSIFYCARATVGGVEVFWVFGNVSQKQVGIGGRGEQLLGYGALSVSPRKLLDYCADWASFDACVNEFSGDEPFGIGFTRRAGACLI